MTYRCIIYRAQHVYMFVLFACTSVTDRTKGPKIGQLQEICLSHIEKPESGANFIDDISYKRCSKESHSVMFVLCIVLG